MNRLFAISFRRIAGRLGAEELPVGKVGEVLEGRGVGRCGEGLLYRLPREELKHIINIPCPVNRYLLCDAVWRGRTVSSSSSQLKN